MDDKIHVRQAVPTDFEAITAVLVASMLTDHDWWDYRCPFRAQFPDDHARYFNQLVQAWLSADYEDWVVVVASVYDDETATYRIGAYSAWDVSYRSYRRLGTAYRPRDSKYINQGMMQVYS